MLVTNWLQYGRKSDKKSKFQIGILPPQKNNNNNNNSPKRRYLRFPPMGQRHVTSSLRCSFQRRGSYTCQTIGFHFCLCTCILFQIHPSHSFTSPTFTFIVILSEFSEQKYIDHNLPSSALPTLPTAQYPKSTAALN